MTLGGDGNAGTMAFLETLNKATIEKKAELDEQKAELELSQGSRPPSGSKPLSTNGSRPTSSLLRDKSGGPLTTLAPLGANAEILEQFTKTQAPINTNERIGKDVARLDDDDDFDLSKGDADSDDENGEGMQGKTTAAEAEVKKPVWSGPSAKETLSAAAQETFNEHNEARALSDIKKMQDDAKAKIAAEDEFGVVFDKERASRYSNAALELAIPQLSSKDWRTRKVAAYDFMDEVIARTKQAKEGKDAETLKFFFDMIEKHFVPLFSDENWWVRKAAVRGIVLLSGEEPTPTQDVVIQNINTSSTYKGRWTSCRAAIRMYEAASAVDKAEESVKASILRAVLGLLEDDHWIVRQEAVNALDKFANDKDVSVKAVQLLSHPEAKVRQVAVSIINKFMEADGKHDALSNKEVAEKMNEAGFASQEVFDALDDNGNGRLSAKELRNGLKDLINIVFSVQRIRTFLGDLANRDMRHSEFMEVVQRRIEEPTTEKKAIKDFYAVKKKEDKEAKEASAKWWKKNGSGMITDIVNDIVNKLPVEYNLAPWVTTKLEMALRVEQDWICKDRLFEGYYKMVAFHDPKLPLLLCDLLLDKRNSGKMCNQVASGILEVANITGDSYVTKGDICLLKHEWIDPNWLLRRGIKERLGRTSIQTRSWDICAAIVDKLYVPDPNLQLVAARCAVRFWDRGAATKELEEAAAQILANAHKKENLVKIAKENYKEDLVKAQAASGVRAGVNPALIKRKKSCKKLVEDEGLKSPRDDEYPHELQQKIADMKKLFREHEEQLERVKKSSKMDKQIMDALKSARKSGHEELRILATEAVDMLSQGAAHIKARKSLQMAVTMVSAMSK